MDPPLVDVKVTNPVTYFKIWWNKLIGNEGIDFRFHIKPVTALAIAVVIATIGFGVGRFVLPFKIPFFEYTETPEPKQTPTNEQWTETAYVGTLQFSSGNNKFFLVTSSSAQAITLEVPNNINLSQLIGKRIFAIGNYNKSLRTLRVTDYKDLEILSKTPIPLPTITPTPSPIPSNSQTPTPLVLPIESPTPQS
jgi:hypothetical protein